MMNKTATTFSNFKGEVSYFDDVKGYGSIKVYSRYARTSVAVSYNDIIDGQSLRRGQQVKFDSLNRRAMNVKILSHQPKTKIYYGTVSSLKTNYGFIKSDSFDQEIFFHKSQTYNCINKKGKLTPLTVNERVEFECYNKSRAVNVKRDFRKIEPVAPFNIPYQEPDKPIMEKELVEIKVDKKEAAKFKEGMTKSGAVYATVKGLANRSVFKDHLNDGNDPLPSNMKHIMKEIKKDLLNNIHVDSQSGSMFLRIDEDNPRFIQAILTGLDDTPYANGLFLFDIYLCHGYPSNAPMIRHITKGGSEISANFTPGGYSPNLHSATGQVCLSLLGTWDGPGWTPGTSNTYQLLSTILFWILGARHPYYMEPGNGGWEGTIDMNKKNHSSTVHDYDRKVLLHVLKHAVLDTIRNPYLGFENIIPTYFKLKKNSIIKHIQASIEDPVNSSIKSELETLLKDIKIALSELKEYAPAAIEVKDDDSDLDMDFLDDEKKTPSAQVEKSAPVVKEVKPKKVVMKKIFKGTVKTIGTNKNGVKFGFIESSSKKVDEIYFNMGGTRQPLKKGDFVVYNIAKIVLNNVEKRRFATNVKIDRTMCLEEIVSKKTFKGTVKSIGKNKNGVKYGFIESPLKKVDDIYFNMDYIREPLKTGDFVTYKIAKTLLNNVEQRRFATNVKIDGAQRVGKNVGADKGHKKLVINPKFRRYVDNEKFNNNNEVKENEPETKSVSNSFSNSGYSHDEC